MAETEAEHGRHDPAERPGMPEKLPYLWLGPRRELSITRNGKTYAGQWIVDDETITVWLGEIGPHSTLLGGTGPEALARQLLNELIDGAEARAKTS